MTPIQQIKAAIQCGEYIGRYLDVRRGVAICPFHKEKTASLRVHDDYFKCFGCSAGGDLITFATQFHGISTSDAIRMLAEEAGVSLAYQPPPAPYDAKKAERIAAECAEWRLQAKTALLASLHSDDYDRILPLLERLESMNRQQIMAAYTEQRTTEQAYMLRESIRSTEAWSKASASVIGLLIDRLSSAPESEFPSDQYGERAW